MRLIHARFAAHTQTNTDTQPIAINDSISFVPFNSLQFFVAIFDSVHNGMRRIDTIVYVLKWLAARPTSNQYALFIPQKKNFYNQFMSK